MQGACGNYPNHLAFNRPLACSGVTHLLADRHRLARLDKLDKVVFGRDHRHTCHNNRRACTLPALGDGYAKNLCSRKGIVVKKLVEVPHAVKQKCIRVTRLDAQILLHHGSVAA